MIGRCDLERYAAVGVSRSLCFTRVAQVVAIGVNADTRILEMGLSTTPIVCVTISVGRPLAHHR